MTRLEIKKTYKLYIGGTFPRTESGRFYNPENSSINVCLGSRKDVRNAITVAENAQAAWAQKTAYNRSQILYRIAEVLEGRKLQFERELQQQGATKKDAAQEVSSTIDRWVYYAGWCDKYAQLFSTVNPVASSYFNFSVLEPMGVVAAISPESSGLLGISTCIATAIAGGNSIVILASKSKPLCGITLAEVLNDSDVPAGVVNVITGDKNELLGHLSSHMAVNAIVYCGLEGKEISTIKEESAQNLKRVITYTENQILSEKGESPYLINALNEVKTTWHPVEQTGNVGSGY